MGLNITIITANYPPEMGAASVRIHHMTLLLRDAGHRVEVLTALPNYPTGRIFDAYRGRLRHRSTEEGICVRRLWLLPSNARGLLNRALSGLSHACALLTALPRMRRNPPDLVLVSTPPLFTGYAGTLLGRRCGSRVVLNVSDLWPLTAAELGALNQGRTYRLLESMERGMYARADAVIGQSQQILDHVQQRMAASVSGFLYYNLQPAAEMALAPRPAGIRKIVYAGLLGVAQGVYELCSRISFRELGTELHIYGAGNETDKIKALIAREPGRGIFYHGAFEPARVGAILKDYHATLVPLTTAIHGALPSKIFMAMAHGLPVFFAGGGEGADIVREAQTGWVSPSRDVTALTRNIAEWAALPEAEYETLRQRCIRAGREQFNKQSQDAAFLQFIERIARGAGALQPGL